MGKDSKASDKPPALKYRQVKINELDKTRRGKHYDLVLGILQQLRTLPPGSAMEIPLAEVGGIGLANLRSTVRQMACIQRALKEVHDDCDIQMVRALQGGPS